MLCVTVNVGRIELLAVKLHVLHARELIAVKLIELSNARSALGIFFYP